MEKSNILVVDDSFSNLLLIKDILSSNENYQVLTENDGDKVIQQLNANKIDLILLDIMMPKTDGYEVCRRIKQDAGFKDIPIVFLTAKIDEASMLRGFELGAADYIKKPFLISELMARVKTHLEIKKSKERLKNELFRHSITQQSLIASQNELSIRNNISQYFLTHQGDEVYPKLLEEIMKHASMEYGAIGYMDSLDAGINIYSKKLICPSLYSGAIETDQSYIFTMEEIGDIALAAIRKQPVIQKNNVSKLFFTKAEVNCMIAVPIIYADKVVGIIACASKYNEYAESSKQKLTNTVNYLAPIIYNRIMSQQARRQLIESINDTQEQERKRFAKDVHDGLGGYLTSLNTYISILKSGMLDQAEQTGMLNEMQKIITETAAEAKNIANNLMPDMINKFGLTDSIVYQYNRLFVNSSTRLNISSNKYSGTESNEKKSAIYRIACELMNNAYKYSQAQEIAIELESADNKIKMTYHDNGIGFNLQETLNRIKEKTVSGLRNIQERVNSLNGQIEIKSAPAGGTTVWCEV